MAARLGAIGGVIVPDDITSSTRARMMRILITGGAGFVGSRIALAYQESEPAAVTVLDNLKRRGSELNLPVFRERGIRFVHGDIRTAEDLAALAGNFDLLIEASAEPSVAAGQYGSPSYTLATNLGGTLNCLEFARRKAGLFLFLSTSRVYSIASLRSIALEDALDRFEVAARQTLPGISNQGISEDFPTQTARSFYGASKLASEMLIQEYADSCGLRAIINRCGVIAGPGQFGKVDQGVFTLWIAHHWFGIPLRYTGFGGEGRQVRDLLHPADLILLIRKQVERAGEWQGDVFNVGGGRGASVSMKEMTQLCRDLVGREVPVTSVADTAPYDIPLYLSDFRKASARFHWAPSKSVRDIIAETVLWIRANEEQLRPLFCETLS